RHMLRQRSGVIIFLTGSAPAHPGRIRHRRGAVKLLGYPESSIGRLMTPHYIAVREGWTIQYVLDYVREHGQDSETLSMIYVVDDQGVLIDDIRIRTFLLAPLTAKVADLMDYRYVAGMYAQRPVHFKVTQLRRTYL